jgi:hypothetical protein
MEGVQAVSSHLKEISNLAGRDALSSMDLGDGTPIHERVGQSRTAWSDELKSVPAWEKLIARYARLRRVDVIAILLAVKEMCPGLPVLERITRWDSRERRDFSGYRTVFG